MARYEMFGSLPDDVDRIFTLTDDGMIRINRGMGQASLALAERQGQGVLFDIDEFGRPVTGRHLSSVN